MARALPNQSMVPVKKKCASIKHEKNSFGRVERASLLFFTTKAIFFYYTEPPMKVQRGDKLLGLK